jgi:hypothetical protein
MALPDVGMIVVLCAWLRVEIDNQRLDETDG